MLSTTTQNGIRRHPASLLIRGSSLQRPKPAVQFRAWHGPAQVLPFRLPRHRKTLRQWMWRAQRLPHILLPKRGNRIRLGSFAKTKDTEIRSCPTQAQTPVSSTGCAKRTNLLSTRPDRRGPDIESQVQESGKGQFPLPGVAELLANLLPGSAPVGPFRPKVAPTLKRQEGKSRTHESSRKGQPNAG